MPGVILLVGSAKRGGSSSGSLGAYLLDRLEERGFTGETILLSRALASKERAASLPAALEKADLLLLSTPLYVDSLPYLVTKAFELIAGRRSPAGGRRRFAAIVNSGFPEASQNDTALAICRLFAREAGLDYAGGLALGGGGAIDGRPLKEAGGPSRHAVKALDLAAAALAEGAPIPEEAVRLMARPFVPRWLYTLVGDYGWKRQAKKYGTADRLMDRPYEKRPTSPSGE